jgi:hypothetical protein
LGSLDKGHSDPVAVSMHKEAARFDGGWNLCHLLFDPTQFKPASPVKMSIQVFFYNFWHDACS